MTYVICEPCIDVKDTACVDGCPVEAIYAEDDVPEEWESFIEKNAEFFAV
jgi:Fe-S-cluster-containing hydrogenase component 2